MKKFLNEFKEFINKGNAMDLAVGVIIGAAFKSIVDSFVLFCFVKMVNGMKAKMEKPKVEETPAEPKKSDELKALEQIVELLKEKQ